jgi:hypothetical protein
MSSKTVDKATEVAFNKNVGDVVRLLLKARRHTVGELGAFLGCTRTNAQDKLGGRTKFTPYELRLIADWLGVPPDVFYGPVDALFRAGVLVTLPRLDSNQKPTGQRHALALAS